LFEHRLLKVINIKEPPYSDRYPELSNYMDVIREGVEWEGMNSRRNVLSTNLIIGGSENPIAISGGKNAVFKNVNNLQLPKDTDPGFVDFKNQNFMLRSDAKVFKELKGFEPIPFDKMGLYIDQYRKTK